ncbi:hypothetical protein NDU88_004176 [Pleurodeles waltl]|uniref:Uncharacterized protein n=1 Tax=Pleurodeles waltl TaxID=8319 RepID=A0AAV7KWZ9_PLEWA|nr:hypothetical protein NDU88_004176 [Pleurodeles waltl]
MTTQIKVRTTRRSNVLTRWKTSVESGAREITVPEQLLERTRRYQAVLMSLVASEESGNISYGTGSTISPPQGLRPKMAKTNEAVPTVWTSRGLMELKSDW